MSIEWSEEIVVANLQDEPSLSDELNSLIERLAKSDGHTPHVVLNGADVTYMNSSNIAQLLKLRKMLAERNAQLRICGLSDEVWNILKITGLDKVFTFAPDAMTALAGLQIQQAEGD